MKNESGPLLPGTKQVLLTFDKHGYRRDGGAATTYVAPVYSSFLPKGLLLWGATVETLVHGIKVGNQNEVDLAGMAPMPGRYFAQSRSFADIVRLAEVGELDQAIDPRQLTQMQVAECGNQVSVTLSGPFEDFCLWGLTYTGGGPYRKASITALTEGFSGRLDHVSLRGIETVLEVSAPNADIAAQLLVGLEANLRGHHHL